MYNGAIEEKLLQIYTHILDSTEMFWAKSAWLKYLCEHIVASVTSFSAQNNGNVWKWIIW